MKYANGLIQQDIYTQAAFNAEYVQVIFKKIIEIFNLPMSLTAIMEIEDLYGRKTQ